MRPAAAAALVMVAGTIYLAGRSSVGKSVPEQTPTMKRLSDVALASMDPTPVFEATSTPVSAAVASPEPARVRFTAHPWAKVRIDEERGFYTPRAEYLSLAPGRHHVVFEHPTLGTAEYDIDVAPGEAQLVRHDFQRVTQ